MVGALFLVSLGFSAAGAFNRFSSAPLLCAFLILGYPRLGGAPLPDTVPIAVTLIAEVFGFGVAVFPYLRVGCLDRDLVRRFTPPAALASAGGSLAAYSLPGPVRLTTWALVLLGVVIAWWMAPRETEEGPNRAPLPTGDAATPVRRVVTTDGATYTYVCVRHEIGLGLTAVGAFVMGLTSFGLGEVETANLAVRCRIPTRVAVGTGLAIACVGAVSAAVTHLALLRASGVAPIPAGLVAATSAGAVAGTVAGRAAASRMTTRAAAVATSAVHVMLALAAVLVLVSTRLPSGWPI